MRTPNTVLLALSVLLSIARAQDAPEARDAVRRGTFRGSPVRYLSEYADNAAGTVSALSAAIADIGATETELVVDVDDTLLDSPTVPATLCLRFINGNTITTTGQALTIQGPLKAGLHRLFSGSGSVILKGHTEGVCPQWWGAAGDGSTDDTAAISAAIDSGASTVFLPTPPVAYVVASALSPLSRWQNLIGEGNTKITVRNDLSDFVAISLPKSNSVVSGLFLDGTDNSQGTAIQVGGENYVTQIIIRDCWIWKFGIGIDFHNSFTNTIAELFIRECQRGMNVTPSTMANTINVLNTRFTACITHDVYMAAPGGPSNLRISTFKNCTFDPGPRVAHIYADKSALMSFDGCYFESSQDRVDTVWAIDSIDSVLTSVTGSFFNDTKGIRLAGKHGELRMDSCWSTALHSEPNDAIVARSEYHTLTISNCLMRSTAHDISSAKASIVNSVLGAKAYSNYHGQTMFPATQAASSAPNTLDDYEEGTWTPVLTTTEAGFEAVSYDPLTGGRYTKIGNLVHIQGFLRTDSVAVGGATGEVVIGGLPFPAAANAGSTNGLSPVSLSNVSDWAGEHPITGIVNAGTSRVHLRHRAALGGADAATAVEDVDTGADKNSVHIGGTYISEQ